MNFYFIKNFWSAILQMHMQSWKCICYLENVFSILWMQLRSCRCIFDLADLFMILQMHLPCKLICKCNAIALMIWQIHLQIFKSICDHANAYAILQKNCDLANAFMGRQMHLPIYKSICNHANAYVILQMNLRSCKCIYDQANAFANLQKHLRIYNSIWDPANVKSQCSPSMSKWWISVDRLKIRAAFSFWIERARRWNRCLDLTNEFAML